MSTFPKPLVFQQAVALEAALPPLQVSEVPAGKTYCLDPLHLTQEDCVAEAQQLRVAGNGPQLCSIVGLTNAGLAFSDLTQPMGLTRVEQLYRLRQAAYSLWCSTREALKQTGNPVVLQLPASALIGLLRGAMYLGDVDETQAAGAILLGMYESHVVWTAEQLSRLPSHLRYLAIALRTSSVSCPPPQETIVVEQTSSGQ